MSVDIGIQTKYGFSINKENEGLSKIAFSNYNRFVFVPFIGPLIEETIFRLWQNYNLRNILISCSCVLILVVTNILHLKSSIISLIIGIGILFCIFIPKESAFFIVEVKEKYKQFFFYLSAFLFGLLHITNYMPLHLNVWFIYPVYVLPQIVMGLSIGHTRIRCGFFYGFLLHSMINIIASVLTH